MRITTSMNHRDRLLAIVEETFHFARVCGFSNSAIRKRIAERVHADSAWPKLPYWAQNRVSHKALDEYQEVYRPKLYARDLESLLALEADKRSLVPYVRWQLRVDGEHVTSSQIIAMREAGDENVWDRVEGAHIWNHRPKLQPYTDAGWRFLNKKEEAA